MSAIPPGKRIRDKEKQPIAGSYSTPTQEYLLFLGAAVSVLVVYFIGDAVITWITSPEGRATLFDYLNVPQTHPWRG